MSVVARRALAPLVVVSAAAFAFAVLLVLVRLLFAALWLTAATMLIKPNEDAFRHGRMPLGLRRLEAASRSEETTPATAGARTRR